MNKHADFITQKLFLTTQVIIFDIILAHQDIILAQNHNLFYSEDFQIIILKQNSNEREQEQNIVCFKSY